ncbi:hypothetical protein WA026_012951 [Henosepilachna vigintioctopunctata]|uniref:Uncharacterized protein n=1 Tax=Henosepilachna vigintioctopunctata TaxID=420089 RepID=A0AAW1TMM9_9CUCU
MVVLPTNGSHLTNGTRTAPRSKRRITTDGDTFQVVPHMPEVLSRTVDAIYRNVYCMNQRRNGPTKYYHTRQVIEGAQGSDGQITFGLNNLSTLET